MSTLDALPEAESEEGNEEANITVKDKFEKQTNHFYLQSIYKSKYREYLFEYTDMISVKNLGWLLRRLSQLHERWWGALL